MIINVTIQTKETKMDFSTAPRYFDSRDVIERIEELTTEFIDATDTDPAEIMSEDDWAFGLGADRAEEMVNLIALQTDGEDVPDWVYGAFFVRDDEFTDYVEQLADDLGAVSTENSSWIVIDWGATADNLKEDYRDISFRGETYWVRA